MAYTREECLDVLRQAAAELGAVPTMDEYDRVSSDDQPAANTIAYRLDEWRTAVEELDVVHFVTWAVMFAGRIRELMHRISAVTDLIVYKTGVCSTLT